MGVYTKEEMEIRERKSRGILQCSTRLRIDILNEEIAIWETKLKDNPDQIPYLGYIRTTLKDRVEELEKEATIENNESINRLKEIRNYPEGSFEHMVNLEQLNYKENA